MKYYLISLLFLCANAIGGGFNPEVVAAWEEIQNSYPQTEKFEKISDGLYSIKNSGFGYEGTLKIEAVFVEDFGGEYGKTAEVVTRLEVKENDLFAEHPRTYARWVQANNLVFDKASKKWGLYKEVTKKKGFGKKKKKPLWEQLLVATFPLLLFIFVFLLAMRAINRKTSSINEKLLESNLLIADQLKRIGDILEKNS